MKEQFIVAKECSKREPFQVLHKCFNPEYNEWVDFYAEAQLLAEGIRSHLAAMMDGGNSDDYASTIYLYRCAEERLVRLNQIFPVIKKYIKEPKSIDEIMTEYEREKYDNEREIH